MRALLLLALSCAAPLPAFAQADPTLPEFERHFELDEAPTGPVPRLDAPSPDVGEPPSAQDGVSDPADGGAEPRPPQAAEAEGDDLDSLFERLRREPSAPRAEALARRIQAAWLESGSATIDLLMLWAGQALSRADHGAAFDLLEQVMVLEPNYPEAWNMRATLNFQLSRYGRSLADIEQTLRREPRHFGALMGLAAILEELGRQEEALSTYEQVLALFPAQRQAQEAVGRLVDETAGTSL